MHLNFAKKFSLQVYKIRVVTLNIDCLKLDTFSMIIVSFFIEDKERMFQFFIETLLVDISIDVTLKIPFFILNNIKINFIGRYIYWKTYTVVEIFLKIRQAKLIRKRGFANAIFHSKNRAFIIYITFISFTNPNIYTACSESSDSLAKI